MYYKGQRFNSAYLQKDTKMTDENIIRLNKMSEFVKTLEKESTPDAYWKKEIKTIKSLIKKIR